MRTLLALSALLALVELELPDVSKGEIGRRVAVSVSPRFEGKLLPPDRCSVRLVPISDFDKELAYPCRDWFQPPADTYRIWVEQQELVSPLHNLLVYSGGPFKGRGLAAVFDVMPGGKVHVPPQAKFPPDHQLRLVNLDSHYRLGTFGRAFERRIRAADVQKPVLMPEGRIIAVTTDRHGNAFTVSPPLPVQQGRPLAVVPKPPLRGSDVLVVLNRPRAASSEDTDTVQIRLHMESGPVPPDVFITSADRVYGVWYGVEGARASLEVVSPTLAFPAEEIKLRPRSVATLRGTLKLLPSVDVSISAPHGALDRIQRKVEFIAAGRKTIRELSIDDDRARAEALPAEPLLALLTIGPWQFAREVDLRSFEDQEVIFDLDPILLRGTVYRGREPAAGTVKFRVGSDWVSATTTANGVYEATLWEPRMYVVEVKVADESTPPFRDYFVDVVRSGTRDFRIPDSRYIARVSDAESGQPLAGAEIQGSNVFRVGEGPEQTTSQRAVADELGEAVLPPLHAGSLRVIARAKGYLESTPMVVAIEEDGQRREIPIRLRAEGSGTPLAIQFRDGKPSPNTEIIAVPHGLSNDIVWRSSTDESGQVIVPKKLQGAVLIVRHPNAAGLARIWSPTAGEPSATWQLPDRVAPLDVRIVDSSGQPVPFAHVVLWADGLPLGLTPLAFLGGFTPVSDRTGHWRANLGQQNYEIIAMRNWRLPVPIALAQPLRRPWPDGLPIRVID